MTLSFELPEQLKIVRDKTKVDEIANRYHERILELDPAFATTVGRTGRETEYADYSPAGLKQYVDAARETLAELAEATPADRQDEITIDVMQERLGLIVEQDEAGLGFWELNPLATIPHEVRMVFDLMPQESAADHSNIVGRLENVAGALASFTETLEHYAKAGSVAAARQVRLLVEQFNDYGKDGGFFDDLAKAAIAADEGLADRATAAATSAKRAFTDLANYLQERLLPIAPEGDAVGEDRYRLHLRSFLGADVDLAETYRWGVAELDRIIAEQERVAGEIKEGASIAEAKEVLNSDPARKLHGTDALRDWMQRLSDEAVKALAGEHFVIAGPMQELECMIAPTQDGGIYYTGPSSDFKRPGRMWWSVPPGVTEFTTWAETSTVYHEGVPGHHLQIATATVMADSLNLYRSEGVWVSGHGEGWALYAERLMEEFGFLNDPGDRMGMLDAQRMRAARVVFDIGVHCGFEIPENWAEKIGHSGVWTADAGYEFLKQNLDIEEGNLQFEFHRYLGWPGQAPSYKVGQRVWEQLRDEALASGKSLKEFHTEALKLGTMGLDSLRRALA
ncbi:DUF885 domain-containing protein [Leucobacter sp. OH1287]|uniref:DUF885 domain-containing protein n=1 Tax=Leucobacter sp. OH1287 TaxID=2491049 RepID=UPI000F5DBFBA|nr:DUF885 domain-containing protein [Leucobacter sp. OH1287]RRD59768.1 DUF885 domain-containing protein [Leucobacter sp. OH1287]